MRSQHPYKNLKYMSRGAKGLARGVRPESDGRTHLFEKEMQNTKPSIFYSFSAFRGGPVPTPKGEKK